MKPSQRIPPNGLNGDHHGLTKVFLKAGKKPSPENGLLEDDISFWGPAYFQGRTVSFREGSVIGPQFGR